jgi:hypothetical protein
MTYIHLCTYPYTQFARWGGAWRPSVSHAFYTLSIISPLICVI